VSSDAQRPVAVVRVRGAARDAGRDQAATEEPLEIRLHERSFAVVMRTPGADRELAAGFLLSEGVIRGADDLGTIAYCTDASDRRANAARDDEDRAAGAIARATAQNVVNVTLAGGSAARLDQVMADRRQVTATASCGVCGRRTIESLAAHAAPIRASWTILASTITALPARLRTGQVVFDDTGGLHAAGLFTRGGALVDVAEDVGRHNAVDKIVGRRLMREELPLADYLLFVSGRTSFEIVQKAIYAGIPIVAAVSAPSTLAIELAEACGVTLVGFVRGDAFNIYTHPERVAE